jgi:predicted metal-dependent phosphoesterase TrpH
VVTVPDFDLQAHSTCSDGALEPAAVVARAAAAGVRLLALTDHDTVAGLPEAIVAAAEHDVGLVPATEISALDGDDDLHILGYQVDHTDPGLLAGLADSRRDREERAGRMIEKLEGLGFKLDADELDRHTEAGGSLGRPHLAAAVVGHPGNRWRLEREGRTEQSAFLEAYLIPGRPAFAGRSRPTMTAAIELIHGAGGVAIWAHPFWDIPAPNEVLLRLERFAGDGLDGVETFYTTHTRHQVRVLHERASALDMLITGSADFHGPQHRRFDRFRAFELYGLEPRLGPIDPGAGGDRHDVGGHRGSGPDVDHQPGVTPAGLDIGRHPGATPAIR